MNIAVGEFLKGLIDGQKSEFKPPNSFKGGFELMKNIRKRVDGRWEFRKMINGTQYSIIKKTKEEVVHELAQFKRQRLSITSQQTTKKSFFDLAKTWFELFKKGKIVSEQNYLQIINNDMSKGIFLLDIRKIELPELQNWLNKLSIYHRKARYCYQIIKNVFKYALQLDIIKKDISQFLQAPKKQGEIGTNLNLEEQKLFLANLDKTEIKNELLFYVLTGCRPSEALLITKKDINFDKNIIYVPGTKTKASKRWIPISETFSKFLKNNFEKMFKRDRTYLSKQFQKYMKLLGIKNKTLYDLRHTFNTNLFYLGVPDKLRQSYMGHSSIVMTNDIYTHIDPTITKNDILKLYNNLYPKF